MYADVWKVYYFLRLFTGSNALNLCTGMGPRKAPAAKLLLEAKAAPRARNSFGDTPLTVACANPDACAARAAPRRPHRRYYWADGAARAQEVVRLLLAHGAHHAPRGLGRFRLADTPRSIRGRMSAVRRSAPRILHRDQPR